MVSGLSRSENMSRIRGRDTGPEIRLRKALWKTGLRYRLQYKLPGRPDLTFVGARSVVFVDGCFWHGCPIHYSAPSTRQAFWSEKLRANVERDLRVDDELAEGGWRVLHVWQHDLKDLSQVIWRVRFFLENEPQVEECPVADDAGGDFVSEARVDYKGVDAPWYQCACGCNDVRVLAVNGPGSLRPRGQRRPDEVRLVCVRCRAAYAQRPGALSSGP